MKSGKWHMEGIKQPNQEKLRMLGKKETYKYLGILEGDTVKQEEMKEKNFKKYLGRTRKFLETKLNSRNLRKILETILKADQRITQTHRPVNKKTNGHA